MLNFKNDEEREILINLDNLLYVQPTTDAYNGLKYHVIFIDGYRLELTWKEHDRFTKALQKVLE